jgi:hypothetical protein
MHDHRIKTKYRANREKNDIDSWCKAFRLFVETCRVERNLAWVLMAFLGASTAFLLALNPILSHLK